METTNYERQGGDSDLDQKNKFIDHESHNQKIIYDQQISQQNFHQKSSPSLPTPNYSSQIQCMHEEILQLRAQIALLQSELACRDYQHEKEKITEDEYQNCECKNEENENDKSNYTSDDLCETADIFDVVKLQQPKSISPYPDQNLNQLNEFANLSISESHKANLSHMQSQLKNHSVNKSLNHNFELPIPKVAERVKLKRAMEEDMIAPNELSSKEVFMKQNILEKKTHDNFFFFLKIYTTEIAEHLVSQFMPPERDASSPFALQNEVVRLQRRAEHLKLQNSVLTLTLSESKQHCNHLYLLCGKYESNAVALQVRFHF